LVLKAPFPRRLNLGCGSRKMPDCLNVDVRAEVAPDVCFDFDSVPFPLPRRHFEHVYALDVIEHVRDVPRFVQEVHELLMPGGIFEVTTPHFSCANSYTDPSHRQHLGYFSFDFFTPGSQWELSPAGRFEILERTLVFHPSHLNGVVARLANRHPELYEHRFAWLFPAWFMIFKLRAV
jgi:SAM-dependent methyltransferase